MVLGTVTGTLICYWALCARCAETPLSPGSQPTAIGESKLSENYVVQNEPKNYPPLGLVVALFWGSFRQIVLVVGPWIAIM